MDLKDILSISGYPDLYKLVAQARTGIIVESIVTKKRMQAYASSRISSLEDIAIYAEEGEVPLKKIFISLFKKEEGKKTIKYNSSSNELKGLFAEVLPTYDKEKVYVSDMKRIIKWYNLFIHNDLITQKDIEEEEKKVAEELEKQKAEKEKSENSEPVNEETNNAENSEPVNEETKNAENNEPVNEEIKN